MSVLHARLRNKCSGLNGDLFRNHIRNNPFCDLCDVVKVALRFRNAVMNRPLSHYRILHVSRDHTVQPAALMTGY